MRYMARTDARAFTQHFEGYNATAFKTVLWHISIPSSPPSMMAWVIFCFVRRPSLVLLGELY